MILRERSRKFDIQIFTDDEEPMHTVLVTGALILLWPLSK